MAHHFHTSNTASRDNNQAQVHTPDGTSVSINRPKSVKFNSTNDSVDWAGWTWNPVTGCLHGCSFCYAREISLQAKMKPFYPFGFEPTFHPHRLAAPKNSKPPRSGDPRSGRVFVCSMADLFGKWVPDEWIQAVFEACLQGPEWEYLFLTKWPKRYAQTPLLPRAWYGASIIQQADVRRVEADMKAFDSGEGLKWVSLEPMLERITFSDLSWCDLLVIGSQSETRQPGGKVPAFLPPAEWVLHATEQARAFGVPVYWKENLQAVFPGRDLPKQQPRKRIPALVQASPFGEVGQCLIPSSPVKRLRPPRRSILSASGIPTGSTL